MPDDDRPTGIDRVRNSYAGVPCAKLRPADAPTRPGQPCGEIHAWCRGHVRSRSAPNYGDPCGSPALLGLKTCLPHGGQLPEARAVNERAKAQREYGRLTGASTPVGDPVRLLAELAGEMRETQLGLRELVAKIQEQEGDALSIEAGAHYETEEGGTGQHPAVTGEGLVVRTPAGAYALHPLFAESQAMDARLGVLLAAMAKLGIEERLAKVEEGQFAVMSTALAVVFERMGLDPALAMGHLAVALRDQEALPGTVSEVIQATATMGVEEDLREPDPGADGRTTTATLDPDPTPPDRPVWP